jgi:hypothetical protein
VRIHRSRLAPAASVGLQALGLSRTDQLINNALVRPRQQRLGDSIVPGHRTRRSRRIRWRPRNRSDNPGASRQAAATVVG